MSGLPRSICRNYDVLWETHGRRKLLSDNVAFYMFGYYALRAYQSKGFTVGINMNSPYWSLFVSFCKRAQEWKKKIGSGQIDLRNKVKDFQF